MTFSREKLILSIKDCINSELMCYQILSQKPNGPIKQYFLEETKRSITRNQEILKQLTMPKLSPNCIFKINSRLFRAIKFGAEKGEDCWYIQEVDKVKHDGSVHTITIGSVFYKTEKDINELIKCNKIEILEWFAK